MCSMSFKFFGIKWWLFISYSQVAELYLYCDLKVDLDHIGPGAWQLEPPLVGLDPELDNSSSARVRQAKDMMKSYAE